MKRITQNLRHAMLALAGAMLALPASAHYLWLQQDKSEGHLYFGEYEETVRERSPGRLDEMPAPELHAVGHDGNATPLHAIKYSSGFRFALPSPDVTVLATESTYAVKDWTQYHIGVVKPMFYARLIGKGRAQTGETLPLDIVPTASADEYRVLFKGAPVAGTEVRVIAPNGWVREIVSSPEGMVRLSLPWKGQYILHAVHLERTAGTFEGKAYEAIRHRTTTTLTWPMGARTEVPTSWRASKPE